MISNQNILKMRALIVLGLGLYFYLGGFMDVVVGDPQPWGQRWRMFHAYGIDVCDVVFTDKDGKRVDRYEALGVDPWRAKTRTRRMSSPEEVESQARQICRKMMQPSALYGEVRCGHRSGWKKALDPKRNLCVRKPKPRQPKPREPFRPPKGKDPAESKP